MLEAAQSAYTHSNNTKPGAVDTASGAGQGSGASGGTEATLQQIPVPVVAVGIPKRHWW